MGLLYQGGDGVLHLLEIEPCNDFLHQCLNLVIAEVADGTLVGVVDVFVGGEFTSLNVQAHFLVGIAEGHSLSGQLVDLLDGELGS